MRTPADRLLSQFDALVSEIPRRTYTLGLPVVITVGDDGKVEVEVDLSEAYTAPEEYDENPLYDHNDRLIDISDEDKRADAQRIHDANINGAIKVVQT